MYQSFKSVIDRMVALIAFIIASPIFLLLTFLLFLQYKGSPFFTQTRPGKKEKLFKVLKFKSMTDRRDKNGVLLPDEERLTSLGKLIRKTSLDELPQFINVILGQMSFVGPRPLLPEYLPLYNKRHARRHEVKPGITGWAQVSGRNALSWQNKFEHDIFYVDNQSLWLDLKIIWMTIIKVFKSEGITDGTNATTTKFTGEL